MIIHSDQLSEDEIRACVPDGCYLAAHYNRDKDWASVHRQGSRSHKIAFSVRLSGSSKYVMANLPDKAATYDEWGEFIAALFFNDEDAKIGNYKNAADFDLQTEHRFPL
jgi:hypothetical protein